eukprot:CAMPEP_0204425046 /NCGR_PEP_ID=MMETSP0470-20130426/47846_1 /ASSEMBLY_ACC=CAM_ASM_000385 /TAXON_ID=2969 /ORGANISM="Oxyrrhis marina" /LENGTH=78 /DNA_ID=CAMNT_0051422621 /DNA_START=55 /DNA_END=289 /DNA_ORIENTATION=-
MAGSCEPARRRLTRSLAARRPEAPPHELSGRLPKQDGNGVAHHVLLYRGVAGSYTTTDRSEAGSAIFVAAARTTQKDD